MVLFGRLEPLPHLEFQREPDQRPIRPRRAAFGRVQPRENRLEHAEQISHQTDDSIASLTEVRASFGIDPSRLVVLRLEAIGSDQRDALERIGVTVVEEVREKRDDRDVFRVLVQFPDAGTLGAFTSEYGRYADETQETTALPYGQRRDLFDAIEAVSTVSPEERTGRRLARDGAPQTGEFYLDVDVWHPGSAEGAADAIAVIRQVVEASGGQVVGTPLRTPSMILAKVRATPATLEALVQLDVIAIVDLPPLPPPEDAFDIYADIELPDGIPELPPEAPVACLVDSGTLAGHPLLRGVILDEVDFESGEHTVVDQNGHGTQVSGAIVYGDLAKRLIDGQWQPHVRIFSAKVLRHFDGPHGKADGWAGFPEEERAEDQLQAAIRHFHTNYGCRIFNLSLGHADRLYAGGRQFSWAEVLDQLARELDVVILVSAGNVPNPQIPAGTTSVETQNLLQENLGSAEHRLIDPATAALALTVGAVSRREDAAGGGAVHLAGSRTNFPSPFTRCGPGPGGSTKPEVVMYGGNYSLQQLAGTVRWRKQDSNLNEPVLNLDYPTGHLIRVACGTSISTGQVTHVAARAHVSLRDQLGREPSANLIRAVVVNSAVVDHEVSSYYSGNQDGLLSRVGFGQPSIAACYSEANRVTMVAEDSVALKSFHIYSLSIPDDFLNFRGRRSVTVTLAYNPPCRLSRRDYIANAMWLEIYRGLTADQIFDYRSVYNGNGEPPVAPARNKVDFHPGGQTVRMSTVQSRSWHSNQGTKLNYRPTDDEPATLQILVGCQPRFPHPEGEDEQPYALVVTFQHEDRQIDLYQALRARVRTRVQVRV